MTQIMRLQARERMALTISHITGHTKPIAQIPRDQIMTVRRLANKGYTYQQVIDELGLDMTVNSLRARCRPLQIKFGRNHGLKGVR